MVIFHFQAYKAALESMGHGEYALKAGFHLNPKAVEEALQVSSDLFFFKANLSVLSYVVELYVNTCVCVCAGLLQ